MAQLLGHDLERHDLLGDAQAARTGSSPVQRSPTGSPRFVVAAARLLRRRGGLLRPAALF